MYLLNPFSALVGVTDTVLLRENDSRVGLVISAPASNPVNLAFGRAAVVGEGLFIPAGTAPVVLRPGVWG